MKKNLRWKVILVLAVIGLSIYLSFPPNKKIQLGLDLSGGVHLVLQVMTDDALNHETDQIIFRLQEELNKELITYEVISKDENRIGRFTVQQFESGKEGPVRDLIDEFIGNDWDVSFSGSDVTLVMKQNLVLYLRDLAVKQSEETIWNRVDELGLTEPTIQRQGGSRHGRFREG